MVRWATCMGVLRSVVRIVLGSHCSCSQSGTTSETSRGHGLGQLGAGGEEELVLEQVLQLLHLAPGVPDDVCGALLADLHQGQFDHGARQEVMGDGVAVEPGLVHAVRGDAEHRLGAAVVALHHALADQPLDRLVETAGGGGPDVGGQRQAALRDVVEHGDSTLAPSSTVSARSSLSSRANVTSEVGVIGVTWLILCISSKAIFGTA